MVPRSSAPARWAAVSIVLAGWAAYAGAFGGPFLYDDEGSVLNNPSLRHAATWLRPPTGGWPTSGRPIFNLTLGINYAFAQLQPRGYHALSLAIHLAAGLALFGVVRRTVSRMGFAPSRACGVAWAAALLWTVHPLGTEAVTYISQRAESLMALFYLLTLYAFIRGAEVGSAGWMGCSVAACALGMATKEVMVTAPVAVLLYDRVFVAGSWRGLQGRWKYYLSLGATWLVLAALMAGGGSRGGTAGFGTAIAWWAYAITQFRGVATYLWLSIWPGRLLFSYGLTLGGPPVEVAIDGLVVLLLAGTSMFAACRGSKLGYLGAWFFLILSPTSTVVPIATELIAEHRAYLPLAAVTTLAAWAGDWFLRRRGARAPLVAAGVVLVATAEGAATFHRNRAYGSVLALWSDTVAKAPDDAGARNNLGNALAEAGRTDEAIAQFEAALRLVPGYDQPHFNLANALMKRGEVMAALPHYEAAVKARPNDAGMISALGLAYRKAGREADALAQFERALAGEAESPVVWYELGNAFVDEDRMAEAGKAFSKALAARPDYPDALVNDAAVRARTGDTAGAIERFQQAVRLQPNAADIRVNLGALLAESGRLAEAEQQFAAAAALEPGNARAQTYLARVRAMESPGGR